MIETLSTSAQTLTRCPAFVIGDDGLPIACDAELRVIATAEIVGDDYGSWTSYSVDFACGHTLADMQSSLRHADEI